MTTRRALLGCMFALSAALSATAQERSITVASTTSTEQSGLFSHILPAFTARTGIQVRAGKVTHEHLARDTGRAYSPL